MGITHATILLNDIMKTQGKDPVCWKTVHNFVKKSDVLKSSRRETKKSGSTNPDTIWARARLAISKQFLAQIELGKKRDIDKNHQVEPGAPGPIYLDGIAWWDENHKKVILGHTSKTEYQVCRDSEGRIASEDNGGTFTPKMPRTAVKFPGEARCCLGCAVIKKPDDTYEGVKAEPFCYTGRKVSNRIVHLHSI